jgi:Cys-tRNA(Pro)/Cys-tRNA(Cys) deacylase
MEPDSPAIKFLLAAGVVFELHIHAGPVHSLEQAARERGETPDQVIRSILFRLAANDYALALMPGPQQISWKALRTHFNQRRLSLADSDEVLAITGYEIGTVNPFGLPRSMPILIDRTILEKKTISIGSGIRGIAILLTPTELLKAMPPYQILALASENHS